MKLLTGALRLVHRNDPRGLVIRDWVENYVMKAFKGRVLPIDEAVGLRCAELHVPVTRPYRHSLIAPVVIVHRMAAVTRDLADFKPMGVAALTPGTRSNSKQTYAAAAGCAARSEVSAFNTEFTEATQGARSNRTTECS